MNASISEDAATGAALGSIVPGIGTVIGGALGTAFGVIQETGLLDSLGKHLFGSAGEEVAQKVLTVAAGAVGLTPSSATPAAVAALPQTVAALPVSAQNNIRVELARIAADQDAAMREEQKAVIAAQLESYRVETADADSARKMAAGGGMLQWGAIVVSALVLGLFALVVMGKTPVPDDGMKQLLYAAVTLVLGFWFGSSARNSGLDKALANSVPMQAVPQLQASQIAPKGRAAK